MADKVFVVSDGTGRTAEQALNAALTQFDASRVEIVRRPTVRSEKKIRAVIREAANASGFIVHTLVRHELRGLMIRLGREANVETIDLMGPLLARLSHRLSVSPSEKPGLFDQLNRDYFRRVETTDYAIRHDDGQRIHELRKAEIVLLGVSRTFKTPLSIYLAFQGWFVANIPIVMGFELPPIVYRQPPSRVFCLDTNARMLSTLRQRRGENLLGKAGDYANFEAVRRELMYARKIFHSRAGWNIVNVTNKPIEEIASEILSLRPVRTRRRSRAAAAS